MIRTSATGHSRLLAAAATLLKATRSPKGGDTLVAMHAGVPLLPGEELAPGVFTAQEYMDALDMLTRMGFLMPAASPVRTRELKFPSTLAHRYVHKILI